MKRDELVQEVIESLARCQRPGAQPEVWRKLGLSHAQIGMLFLILHRRNANVKQIAEHLGVTKSAITQLLDPLVSKGFVIRQNDPSDRRIVRFNLTPEGRDMLKEVHKYKFASMRSALNTLSDEELEQLSKLCKKAMANLNQQITET